MHLALKSSLLLLLSAVACGPARLGSVDDSETSTADATDATDASMSTATSEPTSTDESSANTLAFDVPGPPDAFVQQCDPFAQDCPEGEKCVAYASTGGNWDANKCVPVMGNQAAGEPCNYGGPVEGTDDCDVDSACWELQEIGGEWTGVCHPFCMGSADEPMCPAGSSCLLSNEGSISLCVNDCDPLAQDCGEGMGCFWANGEFECGLTSFDIPVGEPCEFINDCAAGLICVGNETLPSCAGASCCTSFCDLTLGDAQCDALVPGTSCVAFYEEGAWPPGGQDLGLCIVPP